MPRATGKEDKNKYKAKINAYFHLNKFRLQKYKITREYQTNHGKIKSKAFQFLC